MLKRIAVRWLPPVIGDALRALLAKARPAPYQPDPEAAPPSTELPPETPPVEPTLVLPEELPEWEIVPNTAETWASLGGWDHDSIVATQLAKWPRFLETVEGPEPLGRSHEATDGHLDLATHNTLISFGYALGLACESGRTVSVLDWGGGLGHYAIYARALFPRQSFDFHVKDLPGLCAAGRDLVDGVTYHTDDSTALARSYDFVLASSAVHYARDPHQKIRELCAASSQYIFITRTPILEGSDDTLVVQRPHRYGYFTEYAGWMLNRQRLIDTVEMQGFRLERQFLVGERTHVPNIDEQAQYYGFLFRKI